MTPMDDARWERLANWLGILFVVLLAVSASITGSPPKLTDSAAKIAKYIRDNDDGLRWASYIGGLGVVAAFLWLGSVWRLMRRAEAVPRLAVAAAVGLAFAGMCATTGGLVEGAVALRGVHAVGNDSARFYWTLGTMFFSATGFGIAVFVGAFSVLIVRTRMLAKPLGWFGLVVAVLNLVSAAGVASIRDVFGVLGFLAFIGFGLFVLAASILMLRAKPAVTGAPETTGAATSGA
jgi:hypothetical protein